MLELKHNFPKPEFKLEAGKSYVTANGKRVDVFDVKNNGATCNVHAYVHRQTLSGRLKKEWHIYAEDGRHKFIWGTSMLDVVGIWIDTIVVTKE